MPWELACSLGNRPWCRRAMMSASVVSRDIEIEPVASISGDYVHASRQPQAQIAPAAPEADGGPAEDVGGGRISKSKVQSLKSNG